MSVMSGIRLAISGQQLGGFGKSLKEILSILKDLSISWIELWTFNLVGGFHDRKCSDEDLIMTRKLLDEYGISVACITNGDAFVEGVSEKPEAYIASMKETIRVAKELNSPFVNCYVYYFALGHYSNINPFVRIMKPIVDYAEKLGVTIVLENEAHDASGTPEGMLKILKALNSEFFKTNFDATNYYQANVEPFPYAYEVLKDYIAYIHLKNGCRFIPGVHPDYARGGPFAPPNESYRIFYPPLPYGAVNIEGLILRLKQDGYDGFCTLEPHVRTLDKLMEYYRVEVSYLKQRI